MVLRWDPVLSCVKVTHGVDGVGVELRSGWLCFWVLVWEPGVLGVVVHVVLAEG